MNLLSRIFVCIVLAASCVASGAKDKPNFLFILMDDMGWTDLGCYGSKFYQSPNIDRLATEGKKFTQAYAACPVCSPTRASVLTGKYPARVKVTDYIPGRKDRPDQRLLQVDGRNELALEETTLPEALKQAGYVSGAFGKWHLGGKGFGPIEQGFDVAPTLGAKGGLPGSDGEGKGDYQITEAALKFIQDNHAKPFFAYVAYYTPHIPLAAPHELVAKYEKKIDPNAPHTNATYAAMIEVADAQIGRLLAKLKELNLAENTVVIFTSDNGGLHVREWKGEVKATQNTPLRAGKGYVYEGGIRVPLIVRWPGVVQPGSTNGAVVCSVDYFPTLLELAGISKSAPVNLDGESLVPLWNGIQPKNARTLYWHYPHYPNQGGEPAGAIRDGNFKLVEFYGDGRWELYDLQNDLGERVNLAGKMPEKAAQLATKLDVWRRNVGAEMNLPNDVWNPSLKRKTPPE